MIQKINKRLRNRKGFTLVELIVVIAVLGILASIAVPRLSGVTSTAKTNADNASIRTMQSAIAIAEANGEIDLNDPTTAVTATQIKSAIVPKYLESIPKSQTGEGWVVTIDTAKSPDTVKISVGATAAAATWDD